MSDLVIYDSKVASATRVREVIIWANQAGEPVGTATESILLLPGSLIPDEASDSPNLSASMAPHCTQSLLTPSSAARILDDSKPVTIAPPASYSPSVASKLTKTPDEQDVGQLEDSITRPAAFESFGVSYSPYRADQGCKTQQDVNNDFQRMNGSYSLVRVYGTDCNQVPLVYAAAKTHGMKLFLGIWNPSTLQKEASDIIAGVDGDWNKVDTISVGNELVNNGAASPQDLIRAMAEARSIFRAAGFSGPVVTVDTFTAAMAHPELCEASDYCAINAHAFFDGTIQAPQAGLWLRDTVSRIRSSQSGNKRIVVTETGWPTGGVANGVAVPGLQNQKAALGSIRESFSKDPRSVILFSAFNDMWKKKTMATFEADQYWGIDGAVSSCDQ